MGDDVGDLDGACDDVGDIAGAYARVTLGTNGGVEDCGVVGAVTNNRLDRAHEHGGCLGERGRSETCDLDVCVGGGGVRWTGGS